MDRKRKIIIERYVNHRCNQLLPEAARPKRVTKQMWKRMDDDARENALLSVIEDPDDRRFDDFLHSDWNKLPGWVQRDMLTEGLWDYVSTGLDVLGMIPGLGVVPDLINAGGNKIAAALTSDPAKKKKYNTAAALSLAASIPGVGLAAGAGKLGTKLVPKVLGQGSKLVKVADKATKISNMPKTMKLLKTLKYGGKTIDPTSAIAKLTKSPKLASMLGGTIGIPYLATKGVLKGDKHFTDFEGGDTSTPENLANWGGDIFSNLYKKFKNRDTTPVNTAKKDVDKLPFQYGPKW